MLGRLLGRSNDERHAEVVDPRDAQETLEHYEIDPDNADRYTTTLLSSLDKAVSVQSGVISKYVDNVRNKTESLDEAQELINKHFKRITTGTGAGAGAAASIPGIGLFAGVAAIGAESVVFLEAAAWYILASAKLRGLDIHDAEQRRALVLLVLSGSKGSAIVDTLVGDLGQGGVSLKSASALTRFSAPTLSSVNSRLARTFLKQATGRLKWAWLSKLMPLGIGAVLGSIANRKLADRVMKHAYEQLPEIPLNAQA